MSKFAVMSEEQIKIEHTPAIHSPIMHRFGAGLAKVGEGVFVIDLTTSRVCQVYCCTIDIAVEMAKVYNHRGRWTEAFEEKSFTYFCDDYIMAKV